MFLVLFILTAGSESIKADGDSLKKYTSPGVVVTATRYGSKMSDIASTVSAVNIEEINISNSYMSTDLLEEIPGVDVMKNGYFDKTDAVIRGIGNRERRMGYSLMESRRKCRFLDVPNVVGIYKMSGRTLKVGMIFKR